MHGISLILSFLHQNLLLLIILSAISGILISISMAFVLEAALVARLLTPGVLVSTSAEFL